MLGLCQVYVSHIRVQRVIENSSFWAMYTSSVSTGFAERMRPILLILRYNGSLVTWTVLSLTTAKFKPLIFSMSGFTLSYTVMILWLPLVACTILLYNHIHMEGWKSCANRGPMCNLENVQWFGEPVLQERTAQKTSLPLLRVLSLTGKQSVHRSVP
jgi:hypothetical protein